MPDSDKRVGNLFRIQRGSYNYGERSVTDKNTAIELLCRSPKFWGSLNEELRKDPEIAMYYQPTGMVQIGYTEYIAAGGDFGPGEDIDAMPCKRIAALKHEPEFSIATVEDLKNVGFLPASYGGRRQFYLVPSVFAFGAPKGFNFQAYFEVQDELAEHLVDKEVAAQFSSQFGEIDVCANIRQRLDWCEVAVYNRAYLNRTVSRVMQAYEKGNRRAFAIDGHQ